MGTTSVSRMSTGAVAGHTPILAGASKIDITPDKEAYIAGYGQNRLSTGIHDPVWARCLVLEIGDTRTAFLALDLVGLFLDDVDEIRNGAANELLPAENIIVSSTHNHEGPDTMGLWGPNMMQSGVDEDYLLSVRERAAQCINSAEKNLKKGEIKIGQTLVDGVAKNGRDKGVLDPVLIAIQATCDGETMATLVNFANHPEALGSGNTLISADWPNYMYGIVEDVLGGVCIFQNGALGGMVTPDVSNHSFEEAERIGLTTGRCAIDCLNGAPTMDSSNITHLSRKIRIPVHNEKFIALRNAGIIKRDFVDGGVETEVHLLRFGSVEMVTLPGEALPRVGLSVKKLMKAEHKILIGLGNDELGYIIPEQDFNPNKYEESMSVGPLAAPQIEHAIASMYRDEEGPQRDR